VAELTAAVVVVVMEVVEVVGFDLLEHEVKDGSISATGSKTKPNPINNCLFFTFFSFCLL
jgi:malic enzyme